MSWRPRSPQPITPRFILSFAPLIRECFATPGVHLIDVPIDYSDNERVLNREIKRLSAQL